MGKLNVSKDELYNLYIVQGLSQRKIAKMLGVHRWDLWKLLTEYGLLEMKWKERESKEKKVFGEDVLEKGCFENYGEDRKVKGEGSDCQVVVDESTLRKLYIDEGKSAREIAKMLGVKEWKVKELLRKYSIKKMKVKKVDVDRDLLYKLYVEEGWSQWKIAEKMGVSRFKVREWLRKFGISMGMRERKKEARERNVSVSDVVVGIGVYRKMGDVLEVRYMDKIIEAGCSGDVIKVLEELLGEKVEIERVERFEGGEFGGFVVKVSS
jgi:transposase